MTGRNLNLEEIIEMAIGIERYGKAFYRRLKELAVPGEARDVFSTLESAERRHVVDFEAVLKSALSQLLLKSLSSRHEDHLNQGYQFLKLKRN